MANAAPNVIFNPQNDEEFRERFATEEECQRYFFSIRWPNGFHCPRCGQKDAWRTSRGMYLCSQCRHQISLTSGTLLENTRKPLRDWFEVFWRLANRWQGVSAAELQRALNLGSYETAWRWLQRARRAASASPPLSDVVEADEMWIECGENARSRRRVERALVLILAQVYGSAPVRIRLVRVADASAKSLRPVIERCVQAGSRIRTDGWPAYAFLPEAGYFHEVVRKEAAVGERLLPGPRQIETRLGAWLRGTFQGAVRLRHLDAYLEEFSFRFNLKPLRSPGLSFRFLMRNAATWSLTERHTRVWDPDAKPNFPTWL